MISEAQTIAWVIIAMPIAIPAALLGNWILDRIFKK
jgi:hypothetical protein